MLDGGDILNGKSSHSNRLVVRTDFRVLAEDPVGPLEHRAICASEPGLSATTTSSGLLGEARTSPQVPSSAVTRTPLTVTTSRIADRRAPRLCLHRLEPRYDTVGDIIFCFVGAVRATCSASPSLRQVAVEISHRLAPVAVQHLEHGDGGDEAIVVAAPDRRIEEEMPGPLEPGQRFEFLTRRLICEWPVFQKSTLTPLPPSSGSVANSPVDFTSTTKIAPSWNFDRSRASISPILSAKISSPSLSTTPPPSRRRRNRATVSAALLHRLRHRVQHPDIFRIRVVEREGKIELAVERDNPDAERAQELRRESAGRAVATGGDSLDRTAISGRLVRSAV